MFLQAIGIAIGTKFAPPYACLAMGYLEETKLYPQLRRHLEVDNYELIVRLFLRYMDDGIVPLPKSLDIKIFENILQSMAGADPAKTVTEFSQHFKNWHEKLLKNIRLHRFTFDF